MPPKKKKLLEETAFSDGGFRGYRFQDDDYANQMAYLFGGEKGEEAAKEILEEANKRFPNPLELIEKKKYIEECIKKRAQEVDQGFRQGMMDIFDGLKHKTSSVKGEEAGKDTMVNIMKNLGLNVDADNVQTHYDPGPPMVLQVTWVNRPTENLTNENSNVNKLAQCYSDCLSPTTGEKNQFDTSWQTHQSNAKVGGPKIEKSEFLQRSDQSFQNTLDSLKKPEMQSKVSEEMSPPSNSSTLGFGS